MCIEIYPGVVCFFYRQSHTIREDGTESHGSLNSGMEPASGCYVIG